MSQHDFDIDNATAAAARVDINLALKALGSLSSGPTSPATTYANMFWYDTSTNWLYVRNEANSAWVRFAYLDQTANKIALVDDTSVVNTSGTQVGFLGDQTTATWQAGTGTTQSLVSPANVKAAVLASAPPSIPTTAQVASATAGISAGSVGSYSFAEEQAINVPYRAIGSTIAGSSLQPCSIFTSGQDGYGTLSGTWRLMASYATTTSYNDFPISLWLRIS